MRLHLLSLFLYLQDYMICDQFQIFLPLPLLCLVYQITRHIPYRNSLVWRYQTRQATMFSRYKVLNPLESNSQRLLHLPKIHEVLFLKGFAVYGHRTIFFHEDQKASYKPHLLPKILLSCLNLCSYLDAASRQLFCKLSQVPFSPHL